MANQLLRSELPKDTLVYLENILAKDPAWLIPDDISFLKARLDYLTSEEKRIFASVLEEEAQSETPKKSKSQAKREEAQSETQEQA